jgi:hypothetical protein
LALPTGVYTIHRWRGWWIVDKDALPGIAKFDTRREAVEFIRARKEAERAA